MVESLTLKQLVSVMNLSGANKRDRLTSRFPKEAVIVKEQGMTGEKELLDREKGL